MSIRTSVSLALVAAGALAVTACQPQVSVSRSSANLQEGLPLEPAAERLVPIRPSAIEGSKVFVKAQCVICHGPQGRGDGPSAATLTAEQKTLLHDLLRLIGITLPATQLPSRPANFHNAVAMRLNSPFSMYETVTRGRPHTGMPSFPRPKDYPNPGMPAGRPSYGARLFGVYLTDEERWNVIFHEFSFATTPAEVARGKQLYETKAIPVEINGVIQT